MSTVYVIENGATVRKDGEQLKIDVPKGGTLLKMPLSKVDPLVIFGNLTVTAPAVRALLDQGAPVVYLSSKGKLLGRLQPFENKNVPLRWQQFQAAADPEARLNIAKSIVKGKLLNQRTLLQRAGREGISKLGTAISRLGALVRQADKAKDLNSLRGVEGAGASEYFRQWPKLIRQLGFPFPGRVRRPPTVRVNSLLSFGYVLLLNEVFNACHVVGFDPYVGYLHMDRYGRPALALDLMEEFRPVLVDSLVLAVINRRILEPEDFDTGLGGVKRMRPHALKKFLGAWEQKRRTFIRHPIYDQQVPYWRVIELQARVLGKVLMGEMEEYIPFLTR
jgi:CRISPR-associated protein Cas1